LTGGYSSSGGGQSRSIEETVVGRLMAIYSPFCRAASAFIDGDAARDRVQRNNRCLHATGLA
jgi:hypothetical protein